MRVPSLVMSSSQRSKVDRAGKRRQHDELREGDVGALRQLRGGLEGLGPVRRQPEDERAEDVDAVLAERLQPRRPALRPRS